MDEPVQVCGVYRCCKCGHVTFRDQAEGHEQLPIVLTCSKKHMEKFCEVCDRRTKHHAELMESGCLKVWLDEHV